MRKSAQIHLGLVASLAMALSSCRGRPTEMQRCVDKDDMVVDDQNCQSTNQNSPYRNHWYYGGSGGYTPGTAASGGSYSPYSGFDPVTSNAASAHSSVTRGGFGAAGEAAGHSS